jgi:hypothetical protein
MVGLQRLTWRAEAACLDAPLNLFFTAGDDDNEPPYPSPEAQTYCNRCPVRRECLAEALRTPSDNDWGVRCGTSSYQRRQMRRGVVRRACIGCGAADTVYDLGDGNQICTSCGVSWFTG